MITRFFATAILAISVPQFADAADYHLYYLGGQSNMDGYGRAGELPDDLQGPVWEFGDVVRAAQAAWVEADGHAALVTTTDDYGYSDPWHYDTAGYIDLGRQFADALHTAAE